ncbi:MAG: EthD domain-containing protein [Deltaproteobacteria bacterium]|nr:EthD domain-containing protein [Deltaproteobacteria bacterium]
MVKLIQCLYRLPNLSQEEFHDHWLECHAPLVHSVKPIRIYIQYHTVGSNPMDRPALSSTEPFDGVAAVCWDSLEALKAEMENGTAYQAVLEDEKLFIDHSRSITCLTEERVPVEVEGSSPLVMVECHRHRPDLDRLTFQESWNNIHGDYGQDIYNQGLMSGFVQNNVISHQVEKNTLKTLGIDVDTYDGIGMAYFESMAKLRKMNSLTVVYEESFEAEESFDDHDQMVSLLTMRYPVKEIVR